MRLAPETKQESSLAGHTIYRPEERWLETGRVMGTGKSAFAQFFHFRTKRFQFLAQLIHLFLKVIPMGVG